ncbi:MAG: hypothetical protein QM755_13045 [Luteolibacter sp.]
MDTMKILLGATVALLIGALAMSWNGMKQGVANAPADEQLRIKQQIEDLNLEVQRLKAEKELRAAQPVAPVPAPIPSPTAEELEEAKAQLAAKEAELKQLEDDKNKSDRKARLYRNEADELGDREISNHDNEVRRSKMIANALVKAVVREYQEDPTLGGVVVMELKMPEYVRVNDVLAIRKNNGILGQVKITDITQEGAVGTPLAGFGNFKPQVGDELIEPPQL